MITDWASEAGEKTQLPIPAAVCRDSLMRHVVEHSVFRAIWIDFFFEVYLSIKINKNDEV